LDSRTPGTPALSVVYAMQLQRHTAAAPGEQCWVSWARGALHCMLTAAGSQLHSQLTRGAPRQPRCRPGLAARCPAAPLTRRTRRPGRRARAHCASAGTAPSARRRAGWTAGWLLLPAVGWAAARARSRGFSQLAAGTGGPSVAAAVTQTKCCPAPLRARRPSGGRGRRAAPSKQQARAPHHPEQCV